MHNPPIIEPKIGRVPLAGAGLSCLQTPANFLPALFAVNRQWTAIEDLSKGPA